MTAPALTIAEILDQPALVPLWPTVGRALGLAESTTYQLASEDRLPIEVIRLGRRRVARTVDLHRFLGLLPEGNGAAPEVQSRATATRNDEAAGVQPAAPVEQLRTSRQ
ncbi:DNA-binding protein [Streptomyces alfalfae]|uniref:DNA-binding protein n=1 Tax=Streptomyces alfalfae TaxID=1642299 RepID=UPI001FD62C85|nr:DNA-binding protein [Streptomyces alfalfae]